jgi:endonuclease/exonuclease/phosphatase family metal-dependent hydrolase
VPILADQPRYYSKCQPEFLKTDHRWKLIQAQLKQEIVEHKNTILCLQELSLSMLPDLELFFRQLNYSLFHHLYGPRSLDYMGVGIAIPVSMQLNSISYINIGDYIHSISKRRENKSDVHQSALSELIQLALCPWEIAMNTTNTLICLQVVVDCKSLCIGTYHMPCLYQEPDVMMIHSSIVKDLIFKLAVGQDLILAGDFNAKPSDKYYQVLIEKNSIDVHFPKSNNFDISYEPNVKQVLKSAYQEKNGSEPIYTNFADTFHSGKFCATLDYILFAGQLIVEDVLELPDQPTGESYPDETHPSDHLMIAATFRLL